MADINLLSSAEPDKEGKSAKGGPASGGNGGARAPKGDDMTMHVPTPEPVKPVERPSGDFSSPAKPAAPPQEAPDSILRQKIQPMRAAPAAPRPPTPLPPRMVVPVPPQPKPAAPSPPRTVIPVPTPPKPVQKTAAPPPSPPSPPKPPRPAPPSALPADKDEGATLRVSLITTGAGAGFSEIALRRRLGTFALIGLLGLVLDGLIFGGLLYLKSQVEKRNVAAEGDVKSIDDKIAAREKELVPVREFQELVQAESAVLDNHAHWTGVLKLLEDTALPDVQFGGLAGADTGSLTFEVFARDYTTLAKQIVAFRNDPRVLKATTGTASADFGESNLLKGVRADLTLAVDPQIFKFNAAQATSQGTVPVSAPATSPTTAPAPLIPPSAPVTPPAPVSVPVP